MAKNNVYKVNTNIALTNPFQDTITSGQAVRVGAYAGVAQTSAEPLERFTIDLQGSWHLEVDGEAGEGDVVHIEDGNGSLNTSGTGEPFGISNGSKGSGSGVLEVAPFGKVQPAPSAPAE